MSFFEFFTFACIWQSRICVYTFAEDTQHWSVNIPAMAGNLQQLFTIEHSLAAYSTAYSLFFSLSLSLSLSLYRRTASRHAWRKSDFSRKLIKYRLVIRCNVQRPSTLRSEARFQRRCARFLSWAFVGFVIKKRKGMAREYNDRARGNDLGNTAEEGPRISPLVQLSRETNTRDLFNVMTIQHFTKDR